MNLKEGDIVSCKENFDYKDNADEFIFTTNKRYIISDIYSYSQTATYIQVYVGENDKYCNFNIREFYKYFNTLKDIRKKKLDRLNSK